MMMMMMIDTMDDRNFNDDFLMIIMFIIIIYILISSYIITIITIIIIIILLVKCPIGIIPYSKPANSNVTAICSGNGRCVSLRDVTRYQTFNSYLNYKNYNNWDANKIFGCVCDHGWDGISCEKKSCPKGDNPLTLPTYGSSEEIQYIDCRCKDPYCTGGLYFSFEGQQTPLIPFDASSELINYRFNVSSNDEEEDDDDGNDGDGNGEDEDDDCGSGDDDNE
jgi:hypothetical protein